MSRKPTNHKQPTLGPRPRASLEPAGDSPEPRRPRRGRSTLVSVGEAPVDALPTGAAGTARSRKRGPVMVDKLLELVLDPDLAKKHMKRARLAAKRANKANYGMN